MKEAIPVSECLKGGHCDFAPVAPADKLARYEVRCAKCGRTVDVDAQEPAEPDDPR